MKKPTAMIDIKTDPKILSEIDPIKTLITAISNAITALWPQLLTNNFRASDRKSDADPTFRIIISPNLTSYL